MSVKLSALLSGKIDKYEYLTAEEILPPDQIRLIEQVKFTYSPLGNNFEKQIKTIEVKKVEALKVLKPVEHQQKVESIEGIFPQKI